MKSDKKLPYNRSSHDLAIRRESHRLKVEGFRCIPIGLKAFPQPDIIAIRDNRIIAVEIDLNQPKQQSLAKYSSVSCFDDVERIRPHRRGSTKVSATKPKSHVRWSAEEIRLLKEGYNCQTVIEICEKLQRSYSSVIAKAFQLGLKA